MKMKLNRHKTVCEKWVLQSIVFILFYFSFKLKSYNKYNVSRTTRWDISQNDHCKWKWKSKIKWKSNSPNVVIVFHELLFLQFFQRFFTSKSFSLFFSILTNRNLKFEISENANNKKINSTQQNFRRHRLPNGKEPKY